MPSFLVVHQLFFELFDVAHLHTIGVLFVQVKPPKDDIHSKKSNVKRPYVTLAVPLSQIALGAKPSPRKWLRLKWEPIEGDLPINQNWLKNWTLPVELAPSISYITSFHLSRPRLSFVFDWAIRIRLTRQVSCFIRHLGNSQFSVSNHNRSYI